MLITVLILVALLVVVGLVLGAVQFGHNIGTVALKARWIGLELTVNRTPPAIERVREPDESGSPELTPEP